MTHIHTQANYKPDCNAEIRNLNDNSWLWMGTPIATKRPDRISNGMSWILISDGTCINRDDKRWRIVAIGQSPLGLELYLQPSSHPVNFSFYYFILEVKTSYCHLLTEWRNGNSWPSKRQIMSMSSPIDLVMSFIYLYAYILMVTFDKLSNNYHFNGHKIILIVRLPIKNDKVI